MRSTPETFADLCREVARSDRISYPLAELNDLLTAASGIEVEICRGRKSKIHAV